MHSKLDDSVSLRSVATLYGETSTRNVEETTMQAMTPVIPLLTILLVSPPWNP
jgi:hypothetical protein